MLYISPMTEDNWKERVRKKLSVYCAKSGRSITDVAIDVGIPRDKIYNLNSKGALNPEDLKRLDDWLHERVQEKGPGATSGRSAGALLADDLRMLADVLDSPDYSEKYKSRKFAAWVKVAYEELPDVLKAFEIPADNDT